jgi:hypothetical protein
MLWEAKKIWSAGEYTLLADTHTADDGVTYAKGDTLVLNEREATRLGYMGVIGPPDGMHAVKARVEGGRGTARDEYLYQMWELSGAWEDQGRTYALRFFLRLDSFISCLQLSHSNRTFCWVMLPPSHTGVR